MSPHPRIAVSSPHMGTMRFEAVLPRVAERYAVWEIFGEGGHYLWDIETVFRELAPSYALRYTAHAPISDINVASFNPEIRQLAMKLLIRTVVTASRMGIDRVTVHPGLRMPMSRWDDERLRALTLDAARELAHVGEEFGVTVCLENMSRNWVFTFQEPDWFGDVFTMSERLRFCYDVAHAHTNGPQTVRRYTEAFAGVTGNVHVSDNDGSLDGHWPLGKGSVPVVDVVRGLEQAGYRGNYVIESNSLEEGVESIGVLEEALRGAGA